MPGVQKPHCEPCMVDHRLLHRMERAAVGEVLDGDQFGAVELAEEQDAGVDRLVARAGRRLRRASTTVQAPQSPSPQPSFVPLAIASSRSQSSTVARGGNRSSATSRPRNRNRSARRDGVPGSTSCSWGSQDDAA